MSSGVLGLSCETLASLFDGYSTRAGFVLRNRGTVEGRQHVAGQQAPEIVLVVDDQNPDGHAAFYIGASVAAGASRRPSTMSPTLVPVGPV